MTLTAGMRVGPYEITGSLGAGGMGEVYRARDARLGRDVAIKILPQHFSADPDRLGRFEREARSLAALNHPHVAQIFGLEEMGRGDGAPSRALVMELVEGEDLSRRLARGPLPLDDALETALQVAEALEAAHERGIVHRDLKPANVKVREDGTVKVLDFGLAKAVAVPTDSDAHDLENSPTFTSAPIGQAATQLGVILGTAHYMAPEQAKGKPVDRRADIWAFGCVLFELLCGRRAFGGDSVTDVLAAVVMREPEWTCLPRETPPAVRQLLARCLEKDPRRRLRDIGEARVTLSDTRAGLLSPRSEPGLEPGRRPGVRAPWFRVAAAGLVLSITAGAAYLIGRRTSAVPERAIMTSFTQVTDQPGIERQPTISPDGKTVVYVSHARGNSDLYLLRIGGRKAILLTEDSPSDDYAPAFSPDGTRIAFRSERSGGGIFMMEATGESVRRVTDTGYDPRWSPDGKFLVVADERVGDPMSRAGTSALWVVNVADGTRRRILAGDGVGPRWSPGGRRIVYWGRTTGSQRDIATVASDGSEETTPVWVTSDLAVDWSPTWSPDGRYVYFASSRGGTMNLWRIATDEATGRTWSAPEPVTTPSAWSGHFEFSADGRSLVFGNLTERTTIWAASFDPVVGAVLGQPRQVLTGTAINSIDVTSDGQSVAFSQRGQPWESLGIVKLDGSGWTRLTDDSSYHRAPKWSPDGRRLLFYMNVDEGNGLWTIRPDGSGRASVSLPGAVGSFVYPLWSSDGSRIAAIDDHSMVVADLTVSPPTIRRFPADPENPDVRPFSWSPDDRWIAGISRRGSRDSLIVLDVQSGARRIRAQQANSPAWLPDSRRLVYAGLSHLMLHDTQTGAERQVMRLDRSSDGWGRTVSLSKDGRTLVYLQAQPEGDIWLMQLEPAR